MYSRFRPLILLLTACLAVLPRSFRYGLLALFRDTPGLLGVGFRYICVRSLAASCGDNVYVGSHSFLTHLDKCQLGNNISIREMCHIGCKGGLKIGDDVSIAHGSSVLTEEHDYVSKATSLRDAPVLEKPIEIESDVWIGAGVRITAGVIIGRGAVVGAGSVVTRPVAPYSVVAGVPARVIRMRE